MNTRFSSFREVRGWGILCLTLLFSVVVNGQNANDYWVQTRAVSDGSEITLRWIPMNFDSWKLGVNEGYTVKRKTIAQNGQALTMAAQQASEVVLGTAFLPLPEQDWQPLKDSSDNASIACGTVYEDDLEITTTDSLDFTKFFAQGDKNESRMTMNLFACDQEYSVADAMGLAYKDNTVVAGEEYVYSVSLNNIPSGKTSRKGTIAFSTNNTANLPVPPTLSATPGDEVVVLNWDKATMGDAYTAYFIEKSSDGGTTFENLNDLPLIGTDGSANLGVYNDSLGDNTNTYIYRMKGISPFGIIGPYSPTVSVVGVPAPVPAFPSIYKVEEDPIGSMKIFFDFSPEYTNEIQGFNIYRSDNKDNGFQKVNSSLLSNTVLSYTDNNPLSIGYYKVEAVDVNNYELKSYPQLAQIADITPPGKPTGLTCKSDPSGLVTLDWAENPEDDINGYKVFTSLSGEGEYFVVSPTVFSDNTYKHQMVINTLNKEAYFKITALDYRENESVYSDYCIVARPDIIPPSSPSINHIQPSTSDVFFRWAPSSSSDVDHHVFQRRIKFDNDWQNIFTFPKASVSEFTDATALSTIDYEYRLLAYDGANNSSSSKIVGASPLDDGFRDSIQNFNAFFIGGNTGFNDQSGHVQLSWVYRDQPTLAGFQIFRAVNNGVMSPLKYINKVDSKAQANGMGTHGYVDFDINIQRGRPSTILVSLPPNLPPQVTNIVVSNGPRNSNIPLPIPVPRNSNLFLYQVMAEFTNGSFSPLTDIVAVFVPIR